MKTLPTASRPMDLACACDAKYFPAFAAMLWSLRKNGGDPASYRVWLIDGGIPAVEMLKLQQAVAPLHLEVIRPCRERLQGLVLGEHFSDATYFRLLLPELLPDETSRVLYLDVDTIITAPLHQLALAPFGGHPLLAVQCSVIPTMSHPKALRNYLKLGYTPSDPYFNAGVMVMDLERFRRERLGDAVLQYVRQNAASIRWADQDCLNAVLGRSWGQLDRRWNYVIDPWAHLSAESLTAIENVRSGAADRPAVLHYLAAWKPWHVDYPHPAGGVFQPYWNRAITRCDSGGQLPSRGQQTLDRKSPFHHRAEITPSWEPVFAPASVVTETAEPSPTGQNGAHVPLSGQSIPANIDTVSLPVFSQRGAIIRRFPRGRLSCGLGEPLATHTAAEAYRKASRDREHPLRKEFARDVIAGLSHRPWSIPSKWFYDQRGIELFCQITAQPEYYLTRCEARVLQEHAERLLKPLREDIAEVVELGAGFSEKTIQVLQQFEHGDVTYRPFDLCQASLVSLTTLVKKRFPDLAVAPFHGDFMRSLAPLSAHRTSHKRRLLLFLGSSIGNMGEPEARVFLSALRAHLDPGDYILIGFDLRKKIDIVHRAYDDAAGVTAQFNLNLLRRINSTFAGNFDLDGFHHAPRYNPVVHAMESFLVCAKGQQVRLKSLDFETTIAAGDEIHTECSHKYSLDQINRLAAATGFAVCESVTDACQWFADSLWCASEAQSP